MHKQRVAILFLALLGMASTFLPWITILGSSIPGTQANGWITFGLFTVAALCALVGDLRRSWQGGGFITFTIPALLASTFAIYEVAYIFLKRSSAPGQFNLLALGHPGVGLYLEAAAGILLVGAAFVLQGQAPRTSAQPVAATASI
jgi:hypothetical protein